MLYVVSCMTNIDISLGFIFVFFVVEVNIYLKSH